MTRIFRGKIDFIQNSRIFRVILPRKIRFMTQIETPLEAKIGNSALLSILSAGTMTVNFSLSSAIFCPYLTKYEVKIKKIEALSSSLGVFLLIHLESEHRDATHF